MSLKYIKTKEDVIIIFPGSLQHKEFKAFEPISAGFVKIGETECVCYGESISLNLLSDKDDSIIATSQFFGML